MKRQFENRRRGVVLLLILGLMAMFAISVLSYMVVTSNMAETAQNSQKLDSVIAVPAENDVDVAIRNLTIGSNNGSNPIAPFSILENMYGNWTYVDGGSENSATEFTARIAIFPNLGYAVLTPCTDFNGNSILSNGLTDYELRQILSGYFEGSGNVLTFLDLKSIAVSLLDDASSDWNADVLNSSTYVLEKVVTDPSSASYMGNSSATNVSYWRDHYLDNLTENDGNTSYYTDFDFWHFKVELSDDLKKFVDDFSSRYSDGINTFNHNAPEVAVRLNRPAYSGTGAGGFSAGSHHDSTFNPDMVNDTSYGSQVAQMRLPFAFWGNASAPDMWPYLLSNTSTLSFRSYWAHLTDANYDPTLPNDSASGYYYGNWNGTTSVLDGNWSFGYGLEPVRMNPSYTAPDSRTPFLAHLFFDENDDANDATPYDGIVPSFHRPEPFQTMASANPYGSGTYLDMYRNMYSAVGVNSNGREAYIYALLRKLTPRPLPLDHWNFTGSNPDVAQFYYGYVDPSDGSIMTADKLASTLGNSGNQWDVDNDNDGVREGIWIPSGLPIRYDKNGTPYATMFSYTVLDLDGRVNVNTAGNWDQLPNKLRTHTRFDGNGNTFTNNEQPYNYVDELADIWGNSISGGVSVNSPFYVSDNLNDTIGWNDDLGYSTKIAERGAGLGSTNVALYEALAAVFDTYNDDSVQTVASNLLWRRNMEQYNGPAGSVDTTDLSWNVDYDTANPYRNLTLGDASSPQPGYYYNGGESDDSLGSRYELFKFFDPTRLMATNAEVASGAFNNGNTATLGEAKMLYPWRGKTTISMTTQANLAPAFDFADTAFRSYDPLGSQIYSYAPRYSSNPYLARQNVRSWEDSPYSIPMLERLLRPSDSDAATLPSQLIDDLRMNSDLYSSAMAGNSVTSADVRYGIRERAKARLALTTISSDVPAASMVFPENFEDKNDETRYGNYGFVDLIRRNVRSELERVFEQKELCLNETETLSDGSSRNVKGTNLYLDRDSRPNSAAVLDRKVDEITAYLASMLPKEILAGEKIDLNALAQKNYWLDVDYDADGNYVQADRDLHNIGLVKRMEYARGLYIVVMTLLYEDMNANRMYDPNDDLVVEDPSTGEKDESEKLSDYIEGSLDLLSFKDAPKKEDVVARELMATRVAQWCANVVDFSDPDATMTPFFFDPTPFDGWWVDGYSWLDGDAAAGPDNGSGVTNRWVNNTWGATDDPETAFLFPSSQGLPSEQMYNFFLDAFNGSESYSEANAANHSVYYQPFENVTDPATGVTTTKYLNSNDLIAKWESKKIEKLEDQTSDLGFRVVWGMERPDLVLTESLNFHDLGVADTEIEIDGPEGVGNGAKSGFGDETFDQVRRPEGSSYLELYCTANPNVPQSRELYDYVNGSWKLRLSKKTPVFTDYDSTNNRRELEFPVWRVAISDSSDPRGLNKIADGMAPDKKKEILKSSNSVYHKARNSVLEWLMPHKDGDRYYDDLNFFSMQPRQFRNAPLPTNSTSIANIASLDQDQGTTNGDDNEEAKPAETANYLSHWKDYNLLSSNILGPAFAATYDNSRLREVELDRILWFCNAAGDGGATETGTKLGTAGAYPDALRTFRNKSDEVVYLKPNQYLVVGPEKKRSIGSAAAKNDKASQQFGQDPKPADTYASSFIDLEKLALANLTAIDDDQKYQYMEAISNIGERGFNISEPLWTSANVDPYYADQTHKIRNDAEFFPGQLTSDSGSDEQLNGVRDLPFELPNDWTSKSHDEGLNASVANFYDNRVANYPITKDEIFGLGTVPAYKSAFVQRVADPNRPYHPVMNPYITVDWNMMDLTVFTGEVVGETLRESIDTLNKTLFTTNDQYAFKDTENKIKLERNLAVGLGEDDKTIAYSDAFSSRQWGSQNQKAFAPNLKSERRPNQWARSVKADGDKGGLEGPTKIGATAGTLGQAPAMPYLPKHTLGFYNDHGKWGKWADETDSNGNTKATFFENGDTTGATGSLSNIGGLQYENLHSVYMNATGDLRVYRGAPRLPFEHLVWNDAPFSNPYELMMVPASAPGRFGLEFNRKNNKDMALKSLYKVDGEKKSSLGAYGFFGFDDWYTDDNVKQKTSSTGAASGSSVTYEKDDELEKLQRKNIGSVGPYFNFFASSKKAGDTLNLVNLLDLVRTPSYYLDSKKLAGYDANGDYICDEFGNTLIYSTHREPGKINLNTLSHPVWNALVNTTDRIREVDRLPGTPWDEFQDSRYPYESKDYDNDGVIDGSADLPYTYFQPAYTTPLWVQLDGSTAPIGSYSTLLAQQDLDTNDVDSIEEEPLFDNVRQRYAQDDAGNTWYSYRYEEEDPTTHETSITTGRSSDKQWLDDNLQVKDDEGNVVSGSILSYEEVTTDRRGNLFDATAEMQRLSGMTTNRSNVFAAWVTVGYFEVERCKPGVNMPQYDPDGNTLTVAMLSDPSYKWYYYYQAIYPDGYTYGKELGEETGEVQRHRGFSIIDRSIPVDFRRGSSVNYGDAILMKRVIE